MSTVVIKNSNDYNKMQMLLNEPNVQDANISKPRGYKSCCSSEVIPSRCPSIVDQLSKLTVSIPTECEVQEIKLVPAMAAKNYQPWYSKWFGY